MKIKRTILVIPPPNEPLTLSEAKEHMRITGTDEDGLISSLITNAREYVEKLTQRKLITQTHICYLSRFPVYGRYEITVPFGQLQRVDSFRYTDNNGNSHAIENLITDSASEPGMIFPSDDWPTVTLPKANGIEITFTCGYYENAPTWQADTIYQENSRIQPDPADGYIYEAKTDGVSGSSQPEWEVLGTEIADGTMSWRYLGRVGIPSNLKHAIRLMVSHWYEHREPYVITNQEAIRVPETIHALVTPYRLF